MKRKIFLLLVIATFSVPIFSQVKKAGEGMVLFHGLVLDAATESPLSHSQIFINRAFTSISDGEGKFAFYVNRNDTVIFMRLGYRAA
ncbi:MAG: hypothetical protein NT092_04040, partial [Bacteroidia bacterium]|nr:hypothetical protein [Bacteroidia bacterium]